MKKIIALVLTLSILMGCKPDKTNTGNLSDINNTYGFSILEKLKGIWKGGVISTTPIGDFPDWTIDFRPISAAQISSKNELDKDNDIFMSFFVTKYNGEYRVAFRNGGAFSGNQRVSYYIADSISENSAGSYYRFSEMVTGKSKGFTEVIFKNDSIIIAAYTNKFNTQSTPTLHMRWSAKLIEKTAADIAAAHFGFPKKTMGFDLSGKFDGMSQSILYSTGGSPAADPYKDNQQPFCGTTNASFSFASSLSPNPNNNVLLLFTTKPLFNGATYDATAIDHKCRYVLTPANTTAFPFTLMHPGSYYYYAIYDADGNKTFNSGDWISINNTTYTLNPSSTGNAITQINFVIP